MIDIELRAFKKEFQKRYVVSFSKFGGLVFLMIPGKAIKHPLKESTFFKTFFEKPSAQYQYFA